MKLVRTYTAHLPGTENSNSVPPHPANFSTVPIYAGLRYVLGNFTLEPQAGFAINKVVASSAAVSGSDTHTNFAWATGVGYMFDKVGLGVRYQSSEAHGSDANLSFVSIHLAYNF